MAAPQFPCVNRKPGSPGCMKEGKYGCKGCLLVAYCGPQCQKSHWTVHKKDCRSDLGKKAWRPDWDLKGRQPAFVGPGDSVMTQFGGKKYLWGNVPAYDVVRLASNEGGDYARPLRLLFAASGDLRNAVKTVSQLPGTYDQPIEVTLNDRDFDIVARNAILLLVALVVEDANEAADCMIHLWYSALIRESDVTILQEQVSPLIKGVCERTEGKTPNKILGKTWTFGQRSLRLELEKPSWDRLLSIVDGPQGLTAEAANEARVAVTLAEHRLDYRERNLLVQTPVRRIAKTRFRRDGLLLPFGYPRQDFQHLNPTIFQGGDAWPMHDNADPLNSWSLKEVEETLSGPATADIYGKLYYYLQGLLGTFHGRMVGAQMSFRLLHLDASLLADHVENASFSRVEVSNISDGGYLGVHRTVGHMAPLLEKPRDNPHATLITLFMNAVEECKTQQDDIAELFPQSQTSRLVTRYLPPTGLHQMSTFSPQVIKMMLARDVVASYDHIFDRYVTELKFSEFAQALEVAVKQEHTVVEKWPFRLKLRPGQPGAQDEFDRLFSDGVSGKERYVEWRRTSDRDNW